MSPLEKLLLSSEAKQKFAIRLVDIANEMKQHSMACGSDMMGLRGGSPIFQSSDVASEAATHKDYFE